MHRCLELAQKGLGSVSPNPLVGAVLVYNDTVIGEGYHEKFGDAHAEVNCLKSVKDSDKDLIRKSTLYVSLEPCSHFGKTPPCSNLIIEKKIPHVVIACKDIYEEVDGKGIRQLQDAGVNVEVGVLEKEARKINKRFFTFHQEKRPYIILKWAQSSNRQLANADHSRVLISNECTNRLVHKWRSEEDGILVGTNTASEDNPSLTTRNWIGRNPVRIVIDRELKLPDTLHLMDNTSRTLVFNSILDEVRGNLHFIKISSGEFLKDMLTKLYELNVQSVIVEGGRKLLQSFLDQKLWDETRIITNEVLEISHGLDAPEFVSGNLIFSEKILTDRIDYYLA